MKDISTMTADELLHYQQDLADEIRKVQHRRHELGHHVEDHISLTGLGKELHLPAKERTYTLHVWKENRQTRYELNFAQAVEASEKFHIGMPSTKFNSVTNRKIADEMLAHGAEHLAAIGL